MKEVVPIARTIVHHDGDILVLQNQDDHEHDWEAAKWEVPGGFVSSHDDAVTDTLTREVQEETGLEIDIEAALERVIVVEDDTWYDCQYFLAHTNSRAVKLSEEHQNHRWISPDAFKDLDWSRHAGYTIPVLANVQGMLQRD